MFKFALTLAPALPWFIAVLLIQPFTATNRSGPPLSLPAAARRQLADNLVESSTAISHVWRDVAPLNNDGTVNAYVEIARHDWRKWEFEIGLNMRAIDRVMPAELGGYPINYGFVPQTISYDGDPFDALVLGPAIDGGTLVRGVIVGLMKMTDEKGLDSKVVVSLPGPDGRPIETLTEADRRRLADYFNAYKRHEAGKFSSVQGWDTAAQGLAFVQTTHTFFRECRRPDERCDLQK